MKRQIFILIFLVIVLNSCDRKDGSNYPYKSWSMEIYNSSSHLIHLKFYSYLLPVLNVDTMVPINQNYILTSGNEDPLGSGSDLISRCEYDSSVVVFDDGKKLIYVHNKILGILNDSANNLLLKGNYLSKNISGNKEIFRYLLDETDYYRAEK